MLINDEGVVIRVSVDQIPTLGRSTQGVKIMKTTDDNRVVWVEKFVGSMDEAAGDIEDVDSIVDDIKQHDQPEEDSEQTAPVVPTE